MGLKEFKIHFDSPYATYYPDQTVTGKVILTIDSTKKIRGIKLSVKGEADTYWSTDRQELNNEGRYINETDVVTAHEEYFKAEFYLLGSSSGEEIELPAGTHTYPFNYVLTPNLPSSFESDFGRVRYTAKASLDRPWKFDQETKVAFTVVSHLDLNQQPNAAGPVMFEKSKTFCCLCCGSPPLAVNISLPVRGYVPGQTIPVKVNVENQSGITVETVKLILQKIVTYTATTPRSETKVTEDTISEVSKGPVGGNETTSYEQNLEVPPLPPSNLKNCGLIDLEYKLKVEACVTGFYHRNLTESTTIYIGTVPLSNYQLPQPPARGTDYHTKPAEAAQGMYPSIPSPSAPEEPTDNFNPQGSSLYPNLAPPSYEESMFGARTLRDREESEHVIGGGDKFAPRYPVYNFKPSE
ncbi:arrestin domain-containing protein 17 [Nasonia vitripennis]|uniref:Arrestin C-terminal-like domain-containing protein n=1 Tax=Nasonia vitripennis TaxID=7425 RepID=A0A7M7H7V9_NASVI|nr:arrestin domain-containing protein 17 [Nasonia vitripennis]XP_008208626.1 arrestin domain-containing protein 17 [Nasonia vitripennis]XP_031785048.1 arrestin domain-containing protein 17 [Nasonia vitripennis]